LCAKIPKLSIDSVHELLSKVYGSDRVFADVHEDCFFSHRGFFYGVICRTRISASLIVSWSRPMWVVRFPPPKISFVAIPQRCGVY